MLEVESDGIAASKRMEIATIGFTQSTAEHSFARLQAARVERLLDIRLRTTSVLAGFAKVPDLAYFLDRICGISYEHDPRLTPTDALLDGYRAVKGSKKMMAQYWLDYAQAFLKLMAERGVPEVLDRAAFAHKTVLLCSEPTAEYCHRRLVAELLAQRWGATVEHL